MLKVIWIKLWRSEVQKNIHQDKGYDFTVTCKLMVCLFLGKKNMTK